MTYAHFVNPVKSCPLRQSSPHRLGEAGSEASKAGIPSTRDYLTGSTGVCGLLLGLSFCANMIYNRMMNNL
ncbi:hypothetical protein KKG29_00370 [Patescibacteria group bacterium]|nr:hypothetical protein [Patescibacteria group bacterium]MBU3999624.1 hypothetical protein [Patescibacteria group bacterium]MBU4057100.1 hypothetical protein [Patescibacteria group bacterium]MBU4368478.1 hypothetical protein [Patescibacteria group bacterium]